SDVFAAKSVLSPLAVFDIGTRNIPAHDLSLVVVDRIVASQMPTIASIMFARPHLHVVSRAAFRSTKPTSLYPFRVIRVSVSARAPLQPLIKANAEVIEHHAIGVETFAAGAEYRNKLRREVQHLPEFCLFFADLIFRPLAVSNVLCRTEHLPRTARRVSLQIALAVHDTNFAAGTNDPMFNVCAHFALNGLCCFPEHKLSIFGMDQFPNCRQVHWTFLRVQSVDAIRLI